MLPRRFPGLTSLSRDLWYRHPPVRANSDQHCRGNAMAKAGLVVSAHPGDFVWRAGAAIALHAKRGYRVKIVCLAFGERGESRPSSRFIAMARRRSQGEASRFKAEDLQRFLSFHPPSPSCDCNNRQGSTAGRLTAGRPSPKRNQVRRAGRRT
jgi:LmbE family N-acetylglucosaminyl deacetylase